MKWHMFCNNFHNALPGSITSKFNCLQIFKFSIFAFHKKKREIFDTKRIKNTSNHCPNRFTVFTQCVNVCEISSFSSANIDHFWKCMNSRENDMARFYRYSSSLKWSEQMTFPMDQICGENPDNHSFLAITMIYIPWRKLDQYYRYMSPDYSQLIAINSYFILDKWSLCTEALCWISF